MTTAVQLAQSVAPGTSLGFKNRIINGDMRIDQRNAGASVSSSNVYVADRWAQFWLGAGALTGQRVADAPTGFINSYKSTVATADASLAASDNYQPFYQAIEGLNIADFAWGSSGAVSVTVSFWVKASIAGTYSVVIRNEGATRSYVSTVSVSTSNVWEYKAVTITGDTSGTWLTNNQVGLYLNIGSVQGSDKQAPSLNTWLSGNYIGHSSCTNWIGTLGATLQITGVQLEKGTAATSFEYRDYGRELQMCQRYYVSLVMPNGGYFYALNTAQYRRYAFSFPVVMRSTPTGTVAGVQVNSTPGSPGMDAISVQGGVASLNGSVAGDLVSWTASGLVTATAEL